MRGILHICNSEQFSIGSSVVMLCDDVLDINGAELLS